MPQTKAQDDDNGGWPTTLRFSRRLGEATRGAEYAMAIEGPPIRRPSAWLAWALRTLGIGAALDR